MPGNWNFLDKLIWLVFWFPFTRIRKINNQLSRKGEEREREEKEAREREHLNNKKATGYEKSQVVRNSKKMVLE